MQKSFSKFSSSSLTIIIASFLAILIQIIDVTSSWGINLDDRIILDDLIIYSVILVVAMLIQAYFLNISARIIFKAKKATSRKALLVAYLYLISQLTVLTLLAYLIGEQMIISAYSINLIQLISGFSLLIAVSILGSLAFKCLTTYISTKTKMAGIYGIAIIALSFQLVSAFFYVEVNLYNKPSYIVPERNAWSSYFSTALSSMLFSLYEITKIISFFAVWSALILFTRSFVKKTGRVKYLILVSIPAVYFLFQYSPILLDQLGVYNTILTERGTMFPYIYNIVFNTSNVGSGILFGVSFFILSKAVVYEHLKYYLIICGAGIMIVFSTNVSLILVLSDFPAWGVVSIAFVLPASFLILIGIDSTTFYVASDIRVRSYLSMNNTQLALFKALASAKASSAAEQKIHQIIKQIRNNVETEVLFSATTESEDIKQYVAEVIAELKKTENGNNTNSSN